MAPRYPRAKWRPLGSQTQAKMRAHDIICLHTMVGTLWGTDSYFKDNGYGGTESHFGVGHDGETLQWQDLDYSADANLNGNHRVISIETADMGEGFSKWNTNGDNVPAWTPEQVERLADLVAWLCRQYNIPCELIPDSKPGRRGIGFHRQGVPGYVVAGGELWSTARGKVCPGQRRINQVPDVVLRARQILRQPAAVALASETSRGDEEMGITLHFFDDNWIPDPAGLNFRGSCPAEFGNNSMVVERAFVRWVSYWGDCTWFIAAHRKNTHDPIGEFDPRSDVWELPPGTRGFTVEGRRENSATIPSASLLQLLK